MKIIISPAKKMNIDTDGLEVRSLPPFMDKTERLHEILLGMSYEELKALWNCNDKIASLNAERLNNSLRKNVTPAILAYEGIQYQYMSPGVFTYDELEYVQSHLAILSGFYGMVRPLDGVVPYRLEMQAKLKGDGFSSLYDFWGSIIADKIFSEADCVINLASKEYSKIVSAYVPEGAKFITCRFGELADGKLIEKGTLCKMARGDMVRYMAEAKAASPEDIKGYSRMGYSFSEELSKENEFVFIK